MRSKEDIRKTVIGLRDSIAAEEKERKDRDILNRVLADDRYRSAGTVMCYASFRSEVDTRSIIAYSLKSGKGTVLPVVDREEKRLRLFEIDKMEDLVSGYMGIPEPRPGCKEMNVRDVDIILVPGVAFDKRCGRIGYGGGYYDRLLGSASERPYLIALAYEEQVVEEVPLDRHDVRMDAVITDRFDIHCLSHTLS